MDKYFTDLIMKKWGLSMEEVLHRIDIKDLSKKEIDDLLVKISWTQYPDVIKKLLEYGEDSSVDSAVKTEADVKAEWKFEKLTNGSLRLLQYKGADSIIIIPEAIGKNKVSEIGEYALSPMQIRIKKEFKEARNRITKVVVGDFIKKMGKGVFKGCENLETVTLSKGIQTLSDSTFENCKKLSGIIIPETVTRLGSAVFWGCESLSEVELPDSITKISAISKEPFDTPNYTFCDCTSLKKVKMPNKLSKIYSDFIGCNSLETVILPGELKTIGERSFFNCSSLRKIDLPQGLESIQWEAFGGCKKLKYLSIPSSVKSISNDAFKDYTRKNIKGLTLGLDKDSPLTEFAEENTISYVIE